MNKKSKNETAAIRTQLAKSSYLEHSNPLYLTSSFAFVEKCRQAGIEVPIIPALKPMATAKQLNLIPHRFHVDLPEPLIQEVIKCKDNKQVRQVGIEWCINQSKELIDLGVPFLHFYSMGKSDNIYAIAKEVF